MTSSRRGVSLLLEVILGIGIFSVALLLLFGLFPSSHRSLVQARNYAMANALAREVMEQERTKQPYASVVSWGPTPFPRGGIVNGVAVETTFSVQSQVTVMDTSPPFNRSLLRVVVSWDEGSAGAANITREVQLETFVVEY